MSNWMGSKIVMTKIEIETSGGVNKGWREDEEFGTSTHLDYENLWNYSISIHI